MSTTARLLSDNLPIEPTVFRGFGTGSQLNFTISGSLGLINPANLIVSLDGAVQEPNIDYSVNNNTVTFTTAPDNGAKVVIVYRNAPYIANTVTPSDGSVTSAKIAAGNVTPDKLSTGAPVWGTGGNVTANGNIFSRNLLLQGDNTNAYIRPTNSNSSLYLGSNNTNQAVILSDGNFGIGTLSPASKLDVIGTIGFGLRSGGQNQPGYLSNIWSNTDGYRFFTLGSTYFNGSNWITNPNASYGSNYVSVIGGDTEGIKFYTKNSTGNTQRTDPTATFNSYERLRIGVDGTIDFKNSPVINSPTLCKAWVNFNGFLLKWWTVATTGNTLTRSITNSSQGIWTIPVNGAPTGSGRGPANESSANGWTTNNHLGMIFGINVGNNFGNIGSIAPIGSLGVLIKIIEILSSTQALFQFVDYSLNNIYNGYDDGTPPSSSSPFTINGNGNTSGFSYYTTGIRASYNVSWIGKSAAGRYDIYFATPFLTDKYTVAGVAKQSNDASAQVWTVGIDTRPNQGLFTTYASIHTYVYNNEADQETVTLMFFGT